MSENQNTDHTKLWDEILKAIVDAMPEQLFPLFKEVYGKDYPKGTPITLLATEYSTYREQPDAPPNSRLTDITLLVNGTDYYHLECQTRNEKEMVIRMVAYDLHVAMRHTTSEDKKTSEVVMHFPRSTVIYPSKNRQLPEFLRCRIIFQDGSEHIYQIPTVRIQSYSLQEIHEKHLTIFIPYVLLRLRPKLDSKRKHPLTKKELTDFVAEAILVLRMTKPLIELPSVREKRLRAEIDALRAENKAILAEKDAELARMKELLTKHNITITP